MAVMMMIMVGIFCSTPLYVYIPGLRVVLEWICEFRALTMKMS